MSCLRLYAPALVLVGLAAVFWAGCTSEPATAVGLVALVVAVAAHYSEVTNGR